MADLADRVRAAQAGDPAAFTWLYQQFHRWAWRLANERLGDEHLAEDIVQEVFAEAFRALPGLREPVAFSQWLRLLVGKHCNRLERRRANRFTAMAEEPEDSAPWQQQAPEAQLPHAVLKDCIERMPPHQRVTGSLFLAGYDAREIADLLEKPLGTVKKRLHDARGQLRRQLGGRATDMCEQLADGVAPAREFVSEGLPASPLADGGELVQVGALRAGKHAAGIALDPLERRLYVANERVGEATGSLCIFDLDSWARLATIQTDRRPWCLAYSATTRRLYVTHYFLRRVAVLDTQSQAWLPPICLKGNPVSISIDPAMNRIYVATLADGGWGGTLCGLSVFAGGDHALLAVVPLGAQTPTPCGTVAVRVDPASRVLYLARGHELVALDSTDPALREIASTCLSPGGASSLGDQRDNAVIAHGGVIKPMAGQGRTPPDRDLDRVVDMAVHHRTGAVYRSLYNRDTIVRSDRRTGNTAAQQRVDRCPLCLEIDGERDRVYVTHGYKGTISILSGATDDLVAVVPVTRVVPSHLGVCGGIKMDPLTRRLYVTYQDAGLVLVLQEGVGCHGSGAAGPPARLPSR